MCYLRVTYKGLMNRAWYFKLFFFAPKEGVSIGGIKSLKIFVKSDINVPLIRLIYEYKKLEEKWS